MGATDAEDRTIKNSLKNIQYHQKHVESVLSSLLKAHESISISRSRIYGAVGMDKQEAGEEGDDSCVDVKVDCADVELGDEVSALEVLDLDKYTDNRIFSEQEIRRELCAFFSTVIKNTKVKVERCPEEEDDNGDVKIVLTEDEKLRFEDLLLSAYAKDRAKLVKVFPEKGKRLNEWMRIIFGKSNKSILLYAFSLKNALVLRLYATYLLVHLSRDIFRNFEASQLTGFLAYHLDTMYMLLGEMCEIGEKATSMMSNLRRWICQIEDAEVEKGLQMVWNSNCGIDVVSDAHKFQTM